MARRRMPRRITQEPAVTYYKPQGIPLRQLAEMTLSVEGLEALRLVDALGFDQEAASKSMAVSKATFCRVLAEARTVVATVLTSGHALRIAGGDYFMGSDAEALPTAAECLRVDGVNMQSVEE